MFNPAHPYEPLTSENSALVLVDHQVGLMSGVRDYSIAELKHNVVGLARAAKALKVPIVATTTARDSSGDLRYLNWSKFCPGCKLLTVRRSIFSMIQESHALSKRPVAGS